jgi:pantothenate synthetase
MSTRVPRAKLLRRLQDLVGSAKNVYLDDRQPDRAGKLIPMLEEAEAICVRLREKYKPT